MLACLFGSDWQYNVPGSSVGLPRCVDWLLPVQSPLQTGCTVHIFMWVYVYSVCCVSETTTCCALFVFPALNCSSFVLDEFKRSYSNEDTATVAIPFFWDNFDKEGWSIWKSTYKYPEDLKLVFMTSNLVSGMFQRLDKLRKYAFASVLILGENNNNQIEGIWVLRGQELAFGVSTLTFHV